MKMHHRIMATLERIMRPVEQAVDRVGGRLAPGVGVLMPDGSRRSLLGHLLPTVLLMLAAMMLVASFFLPYWSMTLDAPQYPDGLEVQVHLTHLEGDVDEIDALNHYLGLPPLDEGGQLERSLAPWLVGVMAALLVAATFIPNRWAGLIAVPTLGFPFGFLADLRYILYDYGHSIDPTSALGGAIEPFTPPLFGSGKIGQFETVARAEPGLYLAFTAVLVTLLGLWFHRAAYKPFAATEPARDPSRTAEVRCARDSAASPDSD